ncbi:MAG: DUF4105 domain-containing protein [Prevotella sp.]|nr:DUF4105 domain-containing protein [Prevotella sp.]
MKHLKNIFNVALVATIIQIGGYFSTVRAQDKVHPLDSVEVSLLTCSPHEEIYSLYGHTALRWHDLRRGGHDWVFNYGVFNYHTKFFVLRFALGQTDYELEAIPFSLFRDIYRGYGSQVTEQVINLTNEEKWKLQALLVDNMQESNRIYRYNYFDNNCTTKARDIIERCLSRKLQYADRQDYTPTYREMINAHTYRHPWAAFGNDLLLGVKADFKPTRRQQEFLPENLMYDFDRAQLYDDGNYVSLVKTRREVVPPGVQVIEDDFPLRPRECAYLLCVLSLIMAAIEFRRKKTFVWWDVAWMLAVGVPGVLIVLMFFSQHPTTSTNLQVLLLNPVPLFFIPTVIRRNSPTRYWLFSALSVSLFLVMGLWQDYAEGLMILALCLLLRVWSNYKNGK